MPHDLSHNPICVALDSGDPDTILELANALGGSVGMMKVGLTAFAACGPSLVVELAGKMDVFLDLKLHDIPAQVGGAVTAVGSLGARFLTIHASGGRDMVAAAAEAATGADGLAILAVTMLTSMDEDDLSDLAISGTASDHVSRLAELAISAGADGLVCSPLEVALLRERFGSPSSGGPILVVPGIRPLGSEQDDQRRTTTPRAALEAGADHIVVGRPITGAPDPVRAAQAILAEVRD